MTASLRVNRADGPVPEWPRGTALGDLPIGNLTAALNDRRQALASMRPGMPADMCRYAIERLEAELSRRAE